MAAVVKYEAWECTTHGRWMNMEREVRQAGCPKCAEDLKRKSARQEYRFCHKHEFNYKMINGVGECTHCKNEALGVDGPQFIHGIERTKVARKTKEDEMSLDRLKRLNLDAIDLDEAAYLVSIGESMKDVYQVEDVEVPEWLTNNLRELRREIGNRQAESREKALREVELELRGLRTREERKSELEARREKLSKALGKPAPVETK